MRTDPPNHSDQMGSLLRAIRGVANCIESASHETTELASRTQPVDDAIPAACWAIEFLATEAAKLVGATAYDA